MKTSSRFACLILLVAVLTALASSAPGARAAPSPATGLSAAPTGGEPASSAPKAPAATGDVSLCDITFADAKHGWAVGFDGAILATTDGGATWRRQPSGTVAPLSNVAFADVRHGWAVGSHFWENQTVWDAYVLSTTDGGASWSFRDLGLEDVPNSLACTGAQSAWIGFWKSLLTTADGGTAWSRLTPAEGSAEDFVSLTFVDAAHAWAISRQGSEIVTSRDGGATWAVTHTQADATFTSITFADALHGWIVGSVKVQRPSENGRVAQGLILATTDGGATWHAQKPQGDGWGRWWLQDVAFADARHGWAVGGFTKVVNSYGLILGTTDGGVTWRPKTLVHDHGQLLAVAASDASHGWAVSYYGLRATEADYGPPLFVPVVKSFRPASGRPGTVVTITGTGFKGVSAVFFAGRRAVCRVVSATTIKATVPAGAVSGRITVKGLAGAALSSASFTVQ